MWPTDLFPDHSYLRLALRFFHLVQHNPHDSLSLYDQSRVCGLCWIDEKEFQGHVGRAGGLIYGAMDGEGRKMYYNAEEV